MDEHDKRAREAMEYAWPLDKSQHEENIRRAAWAIRAAVAAERERCAQVADRAAGLFMRRAQRDGLAVDALLADEAGMCARSIRRGLAPAPLASPAQAERVSEEEDALRNLLAVVHRDGGHHASEHGLRASAEAAETEVLRLRSGLERADESLAQSLGFHDEAALCIAEAAQARRSLENVRMLAMRLRRTDPENAEHFLRFCAEAGVTGSVLRSEADALEVGT